MKEQLRKELRKKGRRRKVKEEMKELAREGGREEYWIEEDEINVHQTEKRESISKE